MVLTRDRSVRDWVRRNGHGGLPAGLDEDPERFRLGRMVRGALTGVWEGAGLEQRALSEGTLSQGGYLIPSPLSASLIDRVRARMAVMQAGALTVPMTEQTLALARLTGGSTVAWKAENQPITQSSMTFDRVTLTAQALPILVTLSAELFEDLSPEATDLIENEMAQALSLELDRACLRGSGTAPEPKGIRSQTGVTLQSLGANGATLLSDHLVDAYSNVTANNITPAAAILSSRTYQTISKWKDATGRYVGIPPSLSDVRFLISNQVPNNITVGTSTDCSEIYTGAFENLLVGIRTDLRLQVRLLDQRFIDNLQYGLICWIRADVALAHGEAFNVTTGVRT